MLGPLKKQYHHGDLREALLSAAEAALTDLPLEAVSLREIARRAGVSHAAPKHHFGTLGGLFAELAAMGFERFVSELAMAAQRVTDTSPHVKMQAMTRAYLRFATSNPAVYGLMFGKRVELEPSPRFAMAAVAAWSQLENDVAKIVGPQQAINGSLLVWSTCHGIAMLMLEKRMPPHIDPHTAIEAVTRMLIAGLRAEGAA
jgi:AcrR family transcriptional regulator